MSGSTFGSDHFREFRTRSLFGELSLPLIVLEFETVERLGKMQDSPCM